MATNWVFDKRTWRSKEAVLPGVWKRKEGGHLIRGTTIDPRTGKKKEIRKVLPETDAASALKILRDELTMIRSGHSRDAPTTRLSFKRYAARLFVDRVEEGIIRSAKSRELWNSVLTRVLFKADFADVYCDRIRRADILEWKKPVAQQIRAGLISPHTANTWFTKLKTIVNAFVAEYELDRNPILGVEPFDTREHRTYTEEEPNALDPEELVAFLDRLRALYPQFYAFAHLGFVLGLRPCNLRPLRRRGPEVDVLWNKKELLIRRSHTRKIEVMDCTKTSKGGTDGDQRIGLDDDTMDVLRWHIERYPWHRQIESDLLFPSRVGGYLAPSALDQPFEDVARVIGLKKRITPRGMRRTYQNLCRLAKVPVKVQMAICGHKTEAMSLHYQHVPTTEQRQALAQVYDLLKFQKTRASGTESGTEPNAAVQ